MQKFSKNDWFEIDKKLWRYTLDVNTKTIKKEVFEAYQSRKDLQKIAYVDKGKIKYCKFDYDFTHFTANRIFAFDDIEYVKTQAIVLEETTRKLGTVREQLESLLAHYNAIIWAFTIEKLLEAENEKHNRNAGGVQS